MQSAWVAEGGYEPVADALFNELYVDAYLLEYDVRVQGDSSRCGSCPTARWSCSATEADQWAKLERLLELTRQVWRD